MGQELGSCLTERFWLGSPHAVRRGLGPRPFEGFFTPISGLHTGKTQTAGAPLASLSVCVASSHGSFSVAGLLTYWLTSPSAHVLRQRTRWNLCHLFNLPLEVRHCYFHLIVLVEAVTKFYPVSRGENRSDLLMEESQHCIVRTHGKMYVLVQPSLENTLCYTDKAHD